MADVFNAIPANLRPQFKGIMYGPDGRPMFQGKKLFQLDAAGIGPAGPYTPPAWLSSPNGTLTYRDATTVLPTIQMVTDASAGALATLQVAVPVRASLFGALRIDLEAFSFSAASPAATVRIGALSSTAAAAAGMIQKSTDDAFALYSGGETNRTLGDPFSFLAPSANQRRQVSVVVTPVTKEVFLLEDDHLRSWRNGTTGWTDGLVTMGVQIQADGASAIACRFSSISVSYYA